LDDYLNDLIADVKLQKIEISLHLLMISWY